MLLNAFRLALGAIRGNGVRSLLTSLGVVIGVASVIIMVNLGSSATRQVTDQLSEMGPNLMFIRAGFGRRGPGSSRRDARPLELVDAEAIAREIDGITVAPVATTSATIISGNTSYATSIVGSTMDYMMVRGRTLASGREFSAQEETRGDPVCILGATVGDELFADADPIGAYLRIDRTTCLVIGMLDEKGEAIGQDPDDMVLMPLAAVQRRLSGNRVLGEIDVSVANADDTDRVKEEVEALLRFRRGIGADAEDDFEIFSMQELAAALEGTTATLTTLLAAIAAVSLVVGGVGIMNIMLVSVTERTREIGLRMAIGARAVDVLTQFLVESLVLSLLGGTAGILLGLGGTYLVTTQLGLPLVISYPAIAIAFVVSALIGVVFGYIPARKAAYLDPIVALRHE